MEIKKMVSVKLPVTVIEKYKKKAVKEKRSLHYLMYSALIKAIK